MKLKIGLPKGSLQEATFKLFGKAGYNISVGARSYIPYIDDAEIEPILLRAQEIPKYVEDGALDCGITGFDWVMENNAKVANISDLVYAKQGLVPVRWVVAVPNNSNIKKASDLKGKRIATELVNVTRKYLKKNKIKALVEFSWGATEVKVGAGLVDAIVELTETGSSLRAHNLRIVDTVCRSTTQLIANKNSLRNPWKRAKIQDLKILLEGALLAEKKVGLKMNVAKKDLEKVISILPAIKKPTISNLSQEGWCALETIIDEDDVKKLIPKLKSKGAQGIIEYPLNKVIY